MKQYYVLSSKKSKDEKVGIVDALSLEEADAIVKVRYQKSMAKGETLYIFEALEPLVFNKDRVVLPATDIVIISKL